jgi:hypothetical protein
MEMMEGLTLVLGAATVWLAIVTSRMAAATSEAVSLEAEPLLAFVSPTWMLGGGPPIHHMGIRLHLSNPGKVLVSYRVERIELFINRQQYVTRQPILNVGGVIHPSGGTTFYTYPYAEVPAPLPNPVVAECRFRISYWASLRDLRWIEATIQADIPLAPSGAPVDFVFREGPIYGPPR